MGDAFEYIIRKFNEAANETSGDHYTPRAAIKLFERHIAADALEAIHRDDRTPHPPRLRPVR